jgi:uncharacterized protein HemX
MSAWHWFLYELSGAANEGGWVYGLWSGFAAVVLGMSFFSAHHFRQRAQAARHHTEQLAQKALHHKEMLAEQQRQHDERITQAREHHEELKAHLTGRTR